MSRPASTPVTRGRHCGRFEIAATSRWWWVVRGFICGLYWKGCRLRRSGMRSFGAVCKQPPSAGREILHRFLRRYDPDAAVRIHANDRQKLIRAVELTLLERQPATVTQSIPRTPLEGFRVLKIGLSPERKALYRQIDARAAAMFEDGLIEETQSLLDAGVSSQAKALQSLGYRQA